MYTIGKGAVLPAATTAAGLAILPQTGMSSVVGIAVAAAAGLTAWAIVYLAKAKYTQS